MKNKEYIDDVENVRGIMTRNPEAVNYLSPVRKLVIQALIRENEGRKQQQTPRKDASEANKAK